MRSSWKDVVEVCEDQMIKSEGFLRSTIVMQEIEICVSNILFDIAKEVSFDYRGDVAGGKISRMGRRETARLGLEKWVLESYNYLHIVLPVGGQCD